MANRIDLSVYFGKEVNWLTVIREAKPHVTSGGNIHRTIRCKCRCGKVKNFQVSPVLSGLIKSCGCYSASVAKKRMEVNNKKHGLYQVPEYNIWSSMKKRCLNPSNQSYPDYGGRGIGVCDSWVKSFEQFYKDMGPRPIGKTLDRIDNNKGYYPENCRWATRTEQCRNQRTNRLITHNGETKCLAEWAKQYGLIWQTLYHRIYISKMPIKESLEKPV